MKYIDQTSYMEGIIVSLDECSVGIDFKGRMGFIKVPKRIVITDYELELGQEIGLNMSYIEVIGPEINEKYIKNIEEKKNKEG